MSESPNAAKHRQAMPFQISGTLLTRNSFLNFFGQTGPLLVWVATVPFIIRALGVERFGLLSIAWVAPEYFMFVDLGLGRATTKYVAEAFGKGEKDLVSRFAWTAVSLQLLLGVLGTLGLISITPILTEQILNIPGELEAEGNAAFQVVALSIPLVLVSGSLTGILAAAQRFDLVNAIGAAFNTANPVLTLVGVLWFDWHLTEIVTILLVSRVFTLIAYCWICLHIFPYLARLPRFHSAELRILLTFGGWMTVSSAVVPVLLYLDRFLIGASVTMAAVAYYTVPYDVVTRLWIIPTSLSAALFPAFSMLSGQGQRARLASLLSQSMKWMLLILGIAVVITTAFARDLLQLWLGPEFASESTLPLQILAIGILVNSMVQVQYAVIQALGRPDLTAKLQLLQVPLHGLLVWWLVSVWGSTGAALAQSIRLSVEAPLLLTAACWMASLPFSSLVSDKLIQSSLFLVLFAGIAVAITNLALPPFLRLGGLGIMLCAVAAVVWRYSLDARQRDQLVKLLCSSA